MTVDQMRIRIANSNPQKWRNKLKSMTDNQVIAVYYRLAKSGELDAKGKKSPKRGEVPSPDQMRFDFGEA